MYLFSAALDLAGGIGGVVGDLIGDLVGELKERLLRTPVADLVDFFDNTKPLIGVNPHCYHASEFPTMGACEVVP